MTAVTDALVVLIPEGAHPVTATVSPTTNGASVPEGNPNLIAADAFVTEAVCIDATLSLKTTESFDATNKILLFVTLAFVPTSTVAHTPTATTGVTLM